MNSPGNFQQLVKSAAAEASASRRELGSRYAAEFVKNPDTFDPHKLMKLGRAGLSSFVEAVGVPTRQVSLPSVEHGGRSAAADDERGGWEEQRFVYIPFELFGALFGTTAGIVLIVASALALHFF